MSRQERNTVWQRNIVWHNREIQLGKAEKYGLAEQRNTVWQSREIPIIARQQLVRASGWMTECLRARQGLQVCTTVWLRNAPAMGRIIQEKTHKYRYRNTNTVIKNTQILIRNTNENIQTGLLAEV